MSKPEWTDEQKLSGARGNALAMIVTTTVLLKRQGLSLEDWAHSAGELLAPGWDGLKGGSALDIAKVTAFNPVSLGGTLVSLAGDEKQATVVFDFPIEEVANQFGSSIEDCDAFITNAQKSIFAHLGIRFSSQRNGERWTYEISY